MEKKECCSIREVVDGEEGVVEADEG